MTKRTTLAARLAAENAETAAQFERLARMAEQNGTHCACGCFKLEERCAIVDDRNDRRGSLVCHSFDSCRIIGALVHKTIARRPECSECEGRGVVETHGTNVGAQCPKCHGEGWLAPVTL